MSLGEPSLQNESSVARALLHRENLSQTTTTPHLFPISPNLNRGIFHRGNVPGLLPAFCDLAMLTAPSQGNVIVENSVC